MPEGIFVNGGEIGLEELRRRARQHLGSDVVNVHSSYNVGQRNDYRDHPLKDPRELMTTF